MRNERLMMGTSNKQIRNKMVKEQCATSRPEWAAEEARGRERESETWPAILLIA